MFKISHNGQFGICFQNALSCENIHLLLTIINYANDAHYKIVTTHTDVAAPKTAIKPPYFKIVKL